MSNSFTIVGHVGQDPEKLEFQGKQLIRFSVADKRFGKEPYTNWYSCTYWGTSKLLEEHIKKGSAVVVSGSLEKVVAYTSKAGEPAVRIDVTARTVEFCPGVKTDQGEEFKPSAKTVAKPAFGGDDDLPF